MSEPSSRRSALLRVGITAATVALFLALTDLRAADVLGAIRGVGPAPFVVGVLASLANLGVGALRWRALLVAYGAKDVPPLATLVRLYLTGHFLNTLIPANVAGDLTRAHLTRASVGAPGALLVVVVERLLGFAGLFAVCGVALAMRPSIALTPGVAFGAAALTLFASAATGPIGGAIGRKLPRLRWLRELPGAPAPLPFAVAWLLSVVSQLVAAWVGYLVFRSTAGLALADALLVVPVALLATYLPTVAGLGARETAFVLLLRPLGVSDSVATGGSLALFVVLVASAAVSGLALLAPARATEPR